MTREYESLKKVLSTIEVEEGLNKDNIIEKIKTELKEQNLFLYWVWEKGNFDLNYVFYPLLSEEKFTLSMMAAENSYTNIVEILLEKEADVNKKDFDDSTPLHRAAKNGHANIVEILLAKEADVNKKDFDDSTPLHLAAENGYANIVEILLAKGAHVNEKDYFGKTPLHFAVRDGHEKTVEVLIQVVANVNAVDNDGKTPLDYAEGKNVIKALLEAGGGSFLKAFRKEKIAGGVTILLGTAIAVALFTTGTIAAQLIPIVIAVVAVTAAALVVVCATYELLKPSTKVDGAEKPSAVLTTNEQQEAAL